MENTDFFEDVVRPSTVLLGVAGLAHEILFDGRRFVVTHKIATNVLTEFDARLSRYLAATIGKGLPAAAVETTINDTELGRVWQPYPTRYTRTLPNALAVAVRLTLGSETTVRAKMGLWNAEDAGQADHVSLTEETAQTLETAIAVCHLMGPAEFLEISGDFNRMMVRPHGAQLEMVTMDLEAGTISVPATAKLKGLAYQGPLHGFDRLARQDPAIRAYLSQARYAVSVAKEDAIHAFRDGAEARIMEFDAALSGRELSGHRLQSARTLVARLQAGLGDTLLGLSEAAQLTALEWAAEVHHMGDVMSLEGPAAHTAAVRPQLVR